MSSTESFIREAKANIELRRTSITRLEGQIERLEHSLRVDRINKRDLEWEIEKIERELKGNIQWQEIDPDNVIKPLVKATLKRCRECPSMVKAHHCQPFLFRLHALEDGSMDRYWKANVDSGHWHPAWLHAVILSTCYELLRQDNSVKGEYLRTSVWNLKRIKDAACADYHRAQEAKLAEEQS